MVAPVRTDPRSRTRATTACPAARCPIAGLRMGTRLGATERTGLYPGTSTVSHKGRTSCVTRRASDDDAELGNTRCRVAAGGSVLPSREFGPHPGRRGAVLPHDGTWPEAGSGAGQAVHRLHVRPSRARREQGERAVRDRTRDRGSRCAHQEGRRLRVPLRPLVRCRPCCPASWKAVRRARAFVVPYAL